MVNEWKGKYNDILEELVHQGEQLEEILLEKDNCIQQLTLELAEKGRNENSFRHCHGGNSYV